MYIDTIKFCNGTFISMFITICPFLKIACRFEQLQKSVLVVVGIFFCLVSRRALDKEFVNTVEKL
jgi:hypothetical protein